MKMFSVMRFECPETTTESGTFFKAYLDMLSILNEISFPDFKKPLNLNTEHSGGERIAVSL